MNSLTDSIRTNLYAFYDSISELCGINTGEQMPWSVSENMPGFWPRLIYRINSDILSPTASDNFSERVKTVHTPELLIASDENIRQTDLFLRQQGFYPFAVWKGMVLTNIPHRTPTVLPGGIEIIRPQSLSDREQWLKIVNTELLAPLKMDEALLEGILSEPAFKVYILKNKGVGVSTILTFTSKDSTGLYLLATARTEQKKGYAGLLVQYILDQYAHGSNNPVILHATQAGEPLYLKLGFKPVNQFYLYRQLKADQ